MEGEHQTARKRRSLLPLRPLHLVLLLVLGPAYMYVRSRGELMWVIWASAGILLWLAVRIAVNAQTRRDEARKAERRARRRGAP